MASTTPNIGLTLPTGTEGWKRSVINGNFMILDTKIGAVGNTSLQSQINTLSSKLTSKYGEIITGIQYEVCANIVTVYFNGVTVAGSSGWTKIADLPSGLSTRYSAHFQSLSGQGIQIAGSAINYRGSAGDIFGACTYVRG